jgi:23S rRNA (guanosine2251-2'-O)-methyltransferase
MGDKELLYGRNAVREALRARRRRVYRVWVAAGAQLSGLLQEIVQLAGAARVPVEQLERDALDRMVGDARHHGVVAETAPYPYVELNAVADRMAAADHPPLVLLLDYVQDPQNLGTLIRTAEAVGVDGLIIPERRAAGVTPAVVNASSGASEFVSIAVAGNLVRAMKELQKRGLWLMGLETVAGAPWHIQADLTGPLGLVIGSEGSGMSRLVRETCDHFMQLPMLGQVNSLNAAVAGSIALYEVWRQRAAENAVP